MKIGIIGAGNVGQAIARLATETGHIATLSNSRSPDTLRELAEKIGCGTTTPENASKTSDIVVLTVPFTAVFSIEPQIFTGRIVIDSNNYYPERDGRIAVLDDRTMTTSEMVADHFREAVIVKAFNAILARDLEEPVEMEQGGRRALPIAGDDATAKSIVASIQSDFGYDTVDAGTLADSWRFERAKPAYCIPMDRHRLVGALAAAERNVDLPEGSWRR